MAYIKKGSYYSDDIKVNDKIHTSIFVRDRNENKIIEVELYTYALLLSDVEGKECSDRINELYKQLVRTSKRHIKENREIWTNRYFLDVKITDNNLKYGHRQKISVSVIGELKRPIEINDLVSSLKASLSDLSYKTEVILTEDFDLVKSKQKKVT